MTTRMLLAAGFGAYLFASSACAARYITPNYRIAAKAPEKERVDSILSYLERVPDAIQRRMNDFGGVVVIFDGKVTDNDSARSLKGQRIPGGLTLYDDIDGIYLTQKKEAFVKQNPAFDYPPGYLELHEYGHLADNAFGRLSDSEDFRSAVEKAAENVAKMMLDPDPFERIENISRNITIFNLIMGGDREQIWADSFARFYLSGESRMVLMKDFRGLHDYFLGFEERAMNVK